LIKINLRSQALGLARVKAESGSVPGAPGEVRVTEWIGAAEAAQRLGIKPASLYSYVSRGVLTPRRGSDGRASLFDAAEIAGLGRRGRPRRAPGAELVIESELTEISDDRLRFRGHDAISLATSRSFEDVAGLLWTGSFGNAAARGPWQATSEAIAAGTAAQAALPPDTYPLERLQVIVPAVAATDRLRLHLDRPAVIAAASSLIAAMVDCLPAAGQLPVAGDDSVAGRLVPRLCLRPPGTGLVAALRAALVLAADHELAASTLAARVAASVRADPYAVVGTGLGTMSGALHGGASLGAEVLLASAAESADAPRVVGELLRRGERIPGLGHFVYQAGDPRAILLLNLIRKAAPDSDRLAVAEAVLAEARRRALPAPNIEFALALLATVAGMIPGAGEAVFAIARTAGWLAHALEEYARATPIRPRGVYTGHAAIT
jgi:citrate synthase